MRSTGFLTAAGLLAFGLMGVAGVESLRASEEAAGRVRNGLLALYDFASPDGDVVADRSGVGRALDLEIRKPEGVRRREGSLEVFAETLIRSPGNASKIADAVRLSGEITIELWIRPSPAEQSGPVDIVTMAPKSAQRNFTLGQDGGRLAIHFRTTRTGTSGFRSSSVPAPRLPAELTHLVYTRSRTGRTRVFLNGERVMEEIVAGSTTGWERFPFALANELGGDRPWLGTFYLAAIYSRGLLPREVERNFRAGADFRAPAATDGEQTAGEGDLFQTKIAPLFSSKCLECHNSSTRRGGFDLSHQAAALAGGASGAVLTPGDADGSRLIELIDAGAMPFGRPPLPAVEKTLLREWVEGGAVWTLEEIVAAAPSGLQRVSETWVQRLTAPEYVESVKSALGVDISQEAAELLPPDPRADGFKNTAYNLNVDLGHVAAYARLAQVIVARMDVREFAGEYADSREPAGERLTPLISKMGRKILRAPLEEDELAMYEGLAGAIGDAGGDFEEVAGYLIEAMLQSPRFLYRIENQRGDGTAWPAGESRTPSASCRACFMPSAGPTADSRPVKSSMLGLKVWTSTTRCWTRWARSANWGRPAARGVKLTLYALSLVDCPRRIVGMSGSVGCRLGPGETAC